MIKGAGADPNNNSSLFGCEVRVASIEGLTLHEEVPCAVMGQSLMLPQQGQTGPAVSRRAVPMNWGGGGEERERVQW